MSRDGKRLVGSVTRERTPYPAVVNYDGTVTELDSYGKGGEIYATSSDGRVSIGFLACPSPPACTASGVGRWSDSAAPTVLDLAGRVRAISSSGAVVAGETDGSSGSTGFIFTTQRSLISELGSVQAMTPDGKYIAGRLQDASRSGLWSAQTATVTNIGASNWTYTAITDANGTDPAVVGYGYITASNSYVGFRWKAGVLTELGVLPGGTSTKASAVSFDGGTVVGSSGSDSLQDAFIWTEKDKLRTLVDELKARGLEPAVDFRITDLRFISDDGKTIVGFLFGTPLRFWRVVLQ